MPRRLKQAYHCQPLARLARQLLVAPAGKRMEQVRRAERLHDEIDPGRTYPVDFLVYRITGYRRDVEESDEAGALLVGEAVQPDLRLMIDQLSRSVRMVRGRNDEEPMETVAELGRRLGVSGKTLGRWRGQGLRWRWMSETAGGRPRIVLPRSAVARFVSDHHERVQRAANFTQVDEPTRQQILHRARRLAEARDVTLNQVARHLARRTGRAGETVRQILEKHEQRHPENPIVADRTGPLTPRQKRVIARAWRRGVPMRRLTTRFHRTRATIYRAVRERRAAAARRVTLELTHLPLFDREDAEQVIRREPPTMPVQAEAKPMETPAALPDALRPWYRQPPVDARKQRALLVRYHYLQHQAVRARARLDAYEPRVRDLEAFEQALAEARQVRAMLIEANLPTVLSVARRHLLGEEGSDGAGESGGGGEGMVATKGEDPQRLVRLLETGQTVLEEAVEAFIPSRNQPFTSFLTNRLLQRYAAQAEGEPGRGGRARAHRRKADERGVEQLAARLEESAAGRNVER